MGEYLAGRVLPPTDRFDVLVRLLGATPAEQGALATARDRIEEARRRPAPGSAVPRQLPFDVYAFTGRTRHLEELDAMLAGAGRPAVVISAVAGTAGVGKTALALRWAHQVVDRFPDGQLYVDLRGYGPAPPLAPAEALAGFLRSLGLDPAHIPADVDERAARYRTEVAQRRLLVVLDNASGADQVRPLLPGTSRCFVVVTSRDKLSGLIARDGARRIDLDVLSTAEAVALLRSLIGGRVDAEPQAARALADACARLPLALRIAGELATAQPGVSLADLLADRPLDMFDIGDPQTAVRSVFSWSYHHLRPLAARAFGLLGLHPGQEIDVYAVAALAGIDVRRARSATDELARSHLVQRTVSGLYTMHDLLRAYARERAEATCTADEVRAAQTRLLDLYAATAATATGKLYPHDAAATVDCGLLTAPVDDAGAAARWLDQQRPNLVAAAAFAAKHGRPRHCVALSRALWRYFEVGGHYQEALAVHTYAVEAAPVGEPGHAVALANLGGVHWWLGDHQQARDCLQRSLAEHRSNADDAGEARAAARLGLVHERLGQYRDAVAQMENALAIYRRTGDRHGEGAQLINLGTVHRRLGQVEAAAEQHRHAAQLFADLGERRLEGYALGNLGMVVSIIGHHDEALVHLERALAYCREAGDRGGEGSAVATIGAVRARQGRHADALDHLRRALEISRETGDRSLETETLNTLGETLYAVGHPAAALAEHRAARAITEQTGDRFEHARSLDGVAAALDATGAADHAVDQWRQALAIYTRLGVPEADRVRERLAARISTVRR